MNLIDINDSNNLYDLALSYIKKGDFKKGILTLEKVKNKNLKILLALLECYEILKIADLKIDTLQQILNLNFNKTYINSLNNEYKLQNLYIKSLSLIKKAIDKYSKDPDFKLEYFSLLMKTKKIALAYQFLKQNKYFFTSENYKLQLALIYREKGKKFRSFWIIKKLTKKHPFNILYRYLLSTLYQNLKMKKKSEKELAYIKKFMDQMPKLLQIPKQNERFPMIFEKFLNDL